VCFALHIDRNEVNMIITNNIIKEKEGGGKKKKGTLLSNTTVNRGKLAALVYHQWKKASQRNQGK